MKFGSLFTGIGGFDLGFEQAGMEGAWQVEIDRSCLSLLERRFPNARRYTDVRECGADNLAAVDLICGGFPCQDLSIAGRRAGLAGERSGLWYEFHRIIAETKPRWVVIENVPGLLSSNKGLDFAIILRGLVECGYGAAWRVLDSQYFGVAQRRRRVFIVGHLGDGRAAEVLFEREGSGWDTAPRREAGQGVAHAISASPTATGRLDPNGQDFVANGFYLSSGTHSPMYSPNGVPPLGAEKFIAFTIQQNDGGNHKRQDRPNGGMYVNETDTALTVGSTDMTAIAFQPGNLTRQAGANPSEDSFPTLGADTQGDQFPHIAWHNKQQSGEIRIQGDTVNAVTQQWGTGGNNVPMVGVRRLTPVECERLQGFPDGWTEGQADSTRYRQLGNAVTVNVIRWIGERIVSCD